VNNKTEAAIILIKGSADTLYVQIPYNTVHIQRIRQVTGRRWEPDAKRWIIPTQRDLFRSLQSALMRYM